MNRDNDVVFRFKAPKEGFNFLRFLGKQKLRDLKHRLLRELLDKDEHPEIVLREYR